MLGDLLIFFGGKKLTRISKPRTKPERIAIHIADVVYLLWLSSVTI